MNGYDDFIFNSADLDALLLGDDDAPAVGGDDNVDAAAGDPPPGLDHNNNYMDLDNLDPVHNGFGGDGPGEDGLNVAAGGAPVAPLQPPPNLDNNNNNYMDLDGLDPMHNGGEGAGEDDLDVAAFGEAAAVPIPPPPPPPVVVDNANATYRDLAQRPPSQPIMFETWRIDFAMRVNQVQVWSERRGRAERIDIIYARHHNGQPHERRAYWIREAFRDCWYGSIRIGTVLRPYLNDMAVPWELAYEEVAVKRLSWRAIRARRNNLITDDRLTEVAALQFVMQQAQLTQQQNNSITKILDVLQDADYLYIVMPFYHYSSLTDVVLQTKWKNIEGAKAIPEPYAKTFFLRILQSLQQLQHLGLCHGDVSLENFVVAREGNVTMIDFGLCLRVPFHDPETNAAVGLVPALDDNDHQMLRRLISPQRPRGTQLYVAPEIYASELPFDGYAIDLWGAAISLFVMLVGEFPWTLPHSDDAIFRYVMNGQQPRPINNDRPFIERLDQCALGRLALHMGCHPHQMSLSVCDLLVRMLRHDPQERLTLAQVMEHPWITGGPRAADQAQIRERFAPRPLEDRERDEF